MNNKTKKITSALLLPVLAVGIITTTLLTTGCGSDDNDNTPSEERKVYGTIPGTSIKVWQEVGVSGTKMAAAFDGIVDIYENALNPVQKTKYFNNSSFFISITFLTN